EPLAPRLGGSLALPDPLRANATRPNRWIEPNQGESARMAKEKGGGWLSRARQFVEFIYPPISAGKTRFPMFILSAFADEIDPDPQVQIDVLKQCGIRHIELRSILKTNVLDLTDLQVQELKALLDKHGFRLSAIGSPVGKIAIDQPF